MGCVSSNLLNQDEEFTQLGSSALGHHIVSLTSTTYGLLTLDPPPQSTTTSPSPQPSFTPGSTFSECKSLWSEPRPVPTRPEVINSWELMSGLGHHIVSLTSTTYGLLTLDPPPQSTTTSPSPQPSFTPGSTFSECKSLWSEPRPVPTRPEVINSWELMSGLDADSFRFLPILDKGNSNHNFIKNESFSKPSVSRSSLLHKFQADSFRFPNTLLPEKENADPNLNKNGTFPKPPFSCSPPLHKCDSGSDAAWKPSPLDNFEKLCPPNGENRVVIYTTTLRGIRKTFEDCNAVRSAIESYGVIICERDISMDRGFKEELRELMKGKEKDSTNQTMPPRVFIKGRYIGGAEEVTRIVDEGWFGDLIKGLPKKKAVCDGCGDVKFLPCFQCNGSCKIVVAVEEERRSTVAVRCTDCNENGLVLCPICS